MDTVKFVEFIHSFTYFSKLNGENVTYSNVPYFFTADNDMHRLNVDISVEKKIKSYYKLDFIKGNKEVTLDILNKYSHVGLSVIFIKPPFDKEAKEVIYRLSYNNLWYLAMKKKDNITRYFRP